VLAAVTRRNLFHAEDAAPQRRHRRLRAVVGIQFGQNPAHMDFNRDFGQIQLASDFLVTFAIRNQFEDVQFTGGQVVQLVPGLAPITILQTNTQTKVMWTDPTTGGTARLQSATNAIGPYVDVAGITSATASPYDVPASANQRFFRTVSTVNK
jgi:hypothetical protein